jgi:hypothetical protein
MNMVSKRFVMIISQDIVTPLGGHEDHFVEAHFVSDRLERSVRIGSVEPVEEEEIIALFSNSSQPHSSWYGFIHDGGSDVRCWILRVVRINDPSWNSGRV